MLFAPTHWARTDLVIERVEDLGQEEKRKHPGHVENNPENLLHNAATKKKSVRRVRRSKRECSSAIIFASQQLQRISNTLQRRITEQAVLLSLVCVPCVFENKLQAW